MRKRFGLVFCLLAGCGARDVTTAEPSTPEGMIARDIAEQRDYWGKRRERMDAAHRRAMELERTAPGVAPSIGLATLYFNAMGAEAAVFHRRYLVGPGEDATSPAPPALPDEAPLPPGMLPPPGALPPGM